MTENARASTYRSAENVDHLLEPQSIAIIGVSSKSVNFGRIILRNVIECGFPHEHTWVIKGGKVLARNEAEIS